MNYYTYFHTRNDTGAVFYIGKGKGKRAYDLGRNPYWDNIVAKHGHNVHFAMTDLSEVEAFEHEKFLILCFKDMGVDLANMTDGGEGASGWKHSTETKDIIRKAILGKKASEETRSKMSKSLKNPSLEIRAKLSENAKNKSLETREKISKANAGKKRHPDVGKKISESLKKSFINRSNKV